jgi:transcriptional regulator with XRE-family HTH domain
MAGRPPVSDGQRAKARALKAYLKARQQESEMTLEEVATRADLNRRTLDKYFEGDSPSPSFFLIVSIARALSLSLDELAW